MKNINHDEAERFKMMINFRKGGGSTPPLIRCNLEYELLFLCATVARSRDVAVIVPQAADKGLIK